MSGIALGFGAVLGLSAWGLERRIHTEVSHREQAAIAHEQETQRLRVQFAVDTHDTVSHSLATQAAIVSVLSRETDDPQMRAALSELAMVNEVAQQDLRTLLTRLRSLSEPGTPAMTPRDEFTQTIESLVRSADAGGITVSTDLSRLPDDLDITLAEQISFIARELVTNMVKHSSAPTGCFLSVWANTDEQRSTVTVAASNPSEEGATGIPRTLSARVEALGGHIIAEQEKGRFSIALQLPSYATSGSISPKQGMPAR
ncbi:MAG TPA: histidine kinase [Arachnia sp.]|nr:histidine kinase [Arachnia sp.]HMT85053.1 histidine kinase [Arachnia sp.]